MKNLLFTWALALLCACPVAAQDFSNKGKDFWLAYTGHIDGNISRMALYISSDVSTSGTVNLNGSTIPFNVTANQATVVQIFPNTYPVINQQSDGIGVGKGIHIVSNDPVVVYAHILNSARSGSSLILPTNTLGRDYIAASFKSSVNSPAGGNGGVSPGSQVAVVAVENNTTVEITPSATDVSGMHPANVPFTVTLNSGDVYQFRTAYGADVTGTRVRSLASGSNTCKPIAVFSGSTWTSMECNTGTGGDNLYQQLMPRSTWGKNYITAPFADRQYDIFRVIVSDPNTVVMKDGTALTGLINNTYYQFNSSTPHSITANLPVMVVQYMISQACDTRNNGFNANDAPYKGDPEMIILNPVEQTINDVTVVSARRDLTPPQTNIDKHFFTIIMKTNAISSLRIDNNPPAGSFISIGTTGYSYLHENVTNSTLTNPSHRIRADSGFIALAYGLGAVESYGYNAGTNVRDLYQFVSVENQYATVDFPAVCRNAPFSFSMTFPYQPTEIKWQFNGLFPDVTITAPVPDATWFVNGRQLWKYKLPAGYTTSVAAGTYPIKVTAQNPTPDGCGNEQVINYSLQVYEKPTAAFTFTTNGCVTDPVQFTDAGNTNGRTATQWNWNFGDPASGAANTSGVKNPSHLFSAAGSFPVKYSFLTDVGCVSDTAEQIINLSNSPVAKFGASAILCIGTPITFSDSSTTPSSTLVKWTWNFGDGQTVVATTNANQTHTYTTAGTYNVTLQVETASGCRSVVYSMTLAVTGPPVPGFNFGNACLPAGTMQFTNTSTNADGSATGLSYIWNFDDGNTSTAANPSHNFTGTGPFNVKLTVTTANGCTANIIRTVNTVYAQPQALFTAPAEVCFGDAVAFTDQSTAAGSSVAQWLWSFDDGTTSTLQNPSKTFSTAGPHEVKLTITSAVGCVSTEYKQTVTVNQLPTADFEVSAPKCVTKNITFTDKSVANTGSLLEWSWDMGDGSNSIKSSNAPFTHNYTNTGTKNVVLVVKTNKGCYSAPFQLPVMVNPLPVPGFMMPENCINDPFSQFTDTSKIADGTEGSFTYLWNFGDPNATPSNPNTATDKNPRHKFTQSRSYDVVLTVTSGNGCVSTITQQFVVNGDVPQAGFTPQGGSEHCSNNTVNISNTSSVDFGTVGKVEIYWDYLNDPTNKVVDQDPLAGKVYTNTYPEFFTPATKTYTVRMVAYSGDNCTDDYSTTITMKATPEISFSALPSMCIDTAAFQLTQATVLNGMTGGVFSGAGVSAGGIFTPAAAGPGTHTIRYTVNAANGCSNYKEQPITVFALPTANAGPDKVILEGGNGTLDGSGTGNNVSFLWTPNQWLFTNTDTVPKVVPLDDITYTLTVTSADGCVATDQVNVKVLKAPTVPNVFTPNGDGVNDTWEIRYLETYQGATVDVYNSYGQIVFQSTNYPRPWDGSYKGKPVPVGTYYYIINPKNGRKQIAGYVDVVR